MNNNKTCKFCGQEKKYTPSNAFIEQFKDALYSVLAEGITNRLEE